MIKKPLLFRLIGFFASLLLTFGAYYLVLHPDYFHMSFNIFIILSLAVLQFIFQFIFFLDLWKEKGPPWNLGVFFSTVSIIFIIIAFSIWVMDNLDYNMMPMPS